MISRSHARAGEAGDPICGKINCVDWRVGFTGFYRRQLSKNIVTERVRAREYVNHK